MNVNVINSLIGSTLVAVDGQINDDELSFITRDGREVIFYHDQDCCESVYIQDIIGDTNDLIGYPLLLAEEVTNCPDPSDVQPNTCESYTWTFYRFATVKGHVTVRWFGSSNGYYSEGVSMRVRPITQQPNPDLSATYTNLFVDR